MGKNSDGIEIENPNILLERDATVIIMNLQEKNIKEILSQVNEMGVNNPIVLKGYYEEFDFYKFCY